MKIIVLKLENSALRHLDPTVSSFGGAFYLNRLATESIPSTSGLGAFPHALNNKTLALLGTEPQPSLVQSLTLQNKHRPIRCSSQISQPSHILSSSTAF